MKRLEFMRLCVLTGVAGSTGLANGSDSLPSDLSQALKGAGVTSWKISEDGEILRLKGKVSDFEMLARKAALLGEGKVAAKGNTLSFQRQGRQMTLDLTT
jgi:hypothetical protein